MASLRREIALANSAGRVWDAIRDFQAVHTRVAPGFLIANTPEDGARVLTFASGAVFREYLVDRDDERRRLVYAIAEKPLLTYSASVQVAEDGAGSRLLWIVDLLPNELAEQVGRQMDAAVAVMRPTLEKA